MWRFRLTAMGDGIGPEIIKTLIATPQGKRYKSLSVTMRKSLGLFTNVRLVSF